MKSETGMAALPVNQILQGDALIRLKEFPDQRFHCCVTSPPYLGLRDYGVSGQMGSEKSLEEFIEKMVVVFREVYRVLRNDGTCWVNIGDAYSHNGGAYGDKKSTLEGTKQSGIAGARRFQKKGFKPKDLMGMAWKLAFALQQPFYTGRIKNELDRVWIAAMMDAEGSFSGFYHERNDGGGIRTGVNVCLTSTCTDMLNKAADIWTASLHAHQQNNERLGKRPVFRWKPAGAKNVGDFCAEIYPYLITKKVQCKLAWNMMQFAQHGRKLGKSKEGPEIKKKRAKIAELMSLFNNGQNPSIPSWIKEPPHLYEPGWYLRQDIIWHKSNAMPESATDRCTRAHEYIFMFSKKQKYYYDAFAIRTPYRPKTYTTFGIESTGHGDGSGLVQSENWARDVNVRLPKQWKTPDGWDTAAGTHGTIHRNGREKGAPTDKPDKQRGHSRRHAGFNDRWDQMSVEEQRSMGANKRSVWTVATAGYKEAHFATFPEELIVDPIRAGCPPGGIVLDPFIGAGTTGLVARKLDRNFIGIELNPKYIAIAENRLKTELGLFP